VAKILFSWVGMHDFRAAKSDDPDEVGPLAKGIAFDDFDIAVVLYDYPEKEVTPYRAWLEARAPCPQSFVRVELESPVHHESIYRSVLALLDEHVERGEDELTFHLSPGTPAMHSIWLLLAKTKYPARLLQSSREEGINEAEVPFDISLELTELLREPDAALTEMAVGRTRARAFRHIVHKSRVMRNLIDLAHRAAQRDISVLLLGETGTGKEVFARAIHQASARARGPFVAVNCGAIPENLIESELFGTERGAYTGAILRKGHFREADGGTVFLDEVGELPLSAQVKLLRVLQEREVLPVGGSKPEQVDVRVIAATHRELQERVRDGAFREDLFYRLAVAVLELPALRERPGDVSALIDALLDEINDEHTGRGDGYTPRSLTPGARQRLLQHTWPGNVRELRNTLVRAAVFSSSEKVRADEIVLFPALRDADDHVMERPLGDGFSVKDLLVEVERAYIERALGEAKTKSEAARMLGYDSYQAMDYRMKALDMKS